MTTTHEYRYPQVGELIDAKYRIDGYVGEGGMGAVAKAWHTVRQAPVALKFMAPHLASSEGAVERFINEAVAASQLKSEHIVQVYDVGKLPGGSPYLVLEYLEGRDAAHLVEKEAPQGLEVPRATHIVFQVLRGLEVAHTAGIIHRDLKPSNCFLIHHESDPEFVKILDFGISKIRKEGSASVTQTNMALGTPLYMAPEQARSARDVDLRVDIYSTGVILYELLTGSAPHMIEGAELPEVLYRLFTTDAPLITTKRQGLPEGLVKVVHTALAREPSQRYGSAREFAEALVPFCDSRTSIEVARFRAAQTHVVTLDAGRVRVQSSPSIQDPAHQTDPTADTMMGQPTTNQPGPVTGHDATIGAGGAGTRGAYVPSQPAVAQTDLSAAKDTNTPSARPAPVPSSRLRLPLIAAGVAIVGVVGVFAFMQKGSSSVPTAHDPPIMATVSTSVPTTPWSVTPTATPTPSVVASQAPSATATPIHTATTSTASTQRVHLNTVRPVE